MVGQRLKIATLAVLAALAATAAHAADLTPMIVPPPQVNNWYLRGNVGIGINGQYDLQYLPNPANGPNDFAFEHSSISDTFFLGGGVGYYWNKWLRFDVTGEYRAKSHVSAFGSYTTSCTDGGGNPVSPCIDTYDGNLSSWVFLGNAYVDLGTWDCFTPFIGAGIGGAYNTLSGFSDLNTTNGGRGFGRNPSNWDLAWALYAGVSYDVTKNFKVELGYRYLNYGSITDTVDCVGGCNPDSYKFGNLYSNDIMLSLRWSCCSVAEGPRYYQPLHSQD